MKWLLSIILVVLGYLLAAVLAKILKDPFSNVLIITLTTWLLLMTKNWLDELSDSRFKGGIK